MAKRCELCVDKPTKVQRKIRRCKDPATHVVQAVILGTTRRIGICEKHFRAEVRSAVTRGGYDRTLKLLRRAQDALKWASGSPSFSKGGEAYAGWVLVMRPVINDIAKELQ